MAIRRESRAAKACGRRRLRRFAATLASLCGPVGSLASCCAFLAFAVALSLSATKAVEAQSRGLIGARAAAVSLAAANTAKDTARPLPIIADAVHLDDGGDSATLTFNLSKPVVANAFVLAKPDRVVVDLPEVDFRVDPQAGNPTSHDERRDSAREHRAADPFAGLIASFRFGLFAPGKSRVVVNLAAPARIVRAVSETASDGGSRLVITLAKTDRAAFLTAASKAIHAAMADAPPPAVPEPLKGPADVPNDLPVVVVDPGHGGIDSGAIDDGLVEKNIVLAFGKELAQKLEATGRYKVVMTRDSDVFIPLGGRVRIARDAHADLFVSIHADSIKTDAADVSGATVYTMSDHASDAEAARTAEKENEADATAGFEGKAQPTRNVSDILFDLTRQETRAYSHVFARTLVNYWRVAARLNKNPERSAGFIVLTAPDVPSVLLELGYLSNVKDAKSLVSPQWRDATTDKVVAAINAFFKERGIGVAAAPAAGPVLPADAANTAAATLDAAK